MFTITLTLTGFHVLQKFHSKAHEFPFVGSLRLVDQEQRLQDLLIVHKRGAQIRHREALLLKS